MWKSKETLESPNIWIIENQTGDPDFYDATMDFCASGETLFLDRNIVASMDTTFCPAFFLLQAHCWKLQSLVYFILINAFLHVLQCCTMFYSYSSSMICSIRDAGITIGCQKWILLELMRRFQFKVMYSKPKRQPEPVWRQKKNPVLQCSWRRNLVDMYLPLWKFDWRCVVLDLDWSNHVPVEEKN